MSPSSSTAKALTELGAIRERWARDPVYFFETVLGTKWLDPPCGIPGCTRCTPYARVMAESVRDNRRTLVSSAHDTAKTHTAGGIAWWWVLSFPPAVVLTTSSTGRQVKRNIWKEIRAAYRGSEFLRDNFPKPNLEDWQYPGEPDWYMFGMSTNPDEAEAGATKIQGQHSPNVLLITDEATAVHRLIWDAAKASLTQSHNHWIAMANPTDPASEFARVWRTGKGWNRIQINAYDTPNLIHGDGTNPFLVTQQWVDEYIGDNGEDHPLVQARVFGRLPDESTVTLISFSDLVKSYRRDPAPKPPEGFPLPTIGVDVARFGDDLTCIYVVRGDRILHVEQYGGKDTVFTAGRVKEVALEFGLQQPSAGNICIDDTGVGGGVTDILRANGWAVSAEDFGARPIDEERFYDRRTELWVAMRDWLKGEAALSTTDADERRRLESDLPGVIYEMRTKGAKTLMKLEAKKDMKKRLGHSPDHGDALCLALAQRTRGVALLDPRQFRGNEKPPSGGRTAALMEERHAQDKKPKSGTIQEGADFYG